MTVLPRPAVIVNDRPALLSESAPHINKPSIVLTVIKMWSWGPRWVLDNKTDWPTYCVDCNVTLTLTYKGCRVQSDLDAVTARIYSCRNYDATIVVPAQKRLTPSLVEEEAPSLNTYLSRIEHKSCPRILRRLKPSILTDWSIKTKNYCAGEGQQQFSSQSVSHCEVIPCTCAYHTAGPGFWRAALSDVQGY
jgi:hypothetical protein